MSSKDDTKGCAAVILLLTVIPYWLLVAWAADLIYSWFIAPEIWAPEIGRASWFGFAAIVSVVKVKTAPVKDHDFDGAHYIAAVINAILAVLMVVGFCWIYKGLFL